MKTNALIGAAALFALIIFFGSSVRVEAAGAEAGLEVGMEVSRAEFQFRVNLRAGDTGRDVVELQKRLIGEGFYSGAASEVFDADTENSVRAYQVSHNIYPTGFVGPMTRGALDGRTLTYAELDMVPSLSDYLAGSNAEQKSSKTKGKDGAVSEEDVLADDALGDEVSQEPFAKDDEIVKEGDEQAGIFRRVTARLIEAISGLFRR